MADGLPPPSIWRVSSVYEPLGRVLGTVYGLVQVVQSAGAMRHWKVAPGSPVKVTVGVWSTVVDGPVPDVGGSGGVRSTVQVVCVTGPALPVASTSRVSSVCTPALRPE